MNHEGIRNGRNETLNIHLYFLLMSNFSNSPYLKCVIFKLVLLFSRQIINNDYFKPFIEIFSLSCPPLSSNLSVIHVSPRSCHTRRQHLCLITIKFYILILKIRCRSFIQMVSAAGMINDRMSVSSKYHPPAVKILVFNVCKL